METEFDRLVKVANRYFKNLSNMAEMLGKNKRTFYPYKNKSQFGKRMLEDLRTKLDVNPEYIKFGRKPMLLTDKQSNGFEYETGTVKNFRKISEEELEYLASVKIYTLTAHAVESKTLVDFDDLPVSTSTLGVGMKLNNKHIEAVRISGFSMEDMGIDDGDLVLFDTQMDPRNGNLIIGILNGFVLIKTYRKQNGTILLESAKQGVEPIIVNEVDDELKIIGVVKHSIKHWY